MNEILFYEKISDCNWVEVFRLLNSEIYPDVRKNFARVALMTAIDHCFTNVAENLIINPKYHIDLNQPDQYDKTPFMLACEKKLFGIVRILLRSSAVVDELREHGGYTDLMLAILRLDTQEAKKIIFTSTFDLNAQEHYQMKSALMLAIENNLSDIAIELINKGANINKQDNLGKTALMLAIENGCIDVAMKLIDSLANINIRDYSGKTALFLAIENRYTDVAMKLIDSFADINMRNHCGKTPLMLAIEKGCTDVAMKLIDRGADINVQDNFGATALMMVRDQPLIVHKLIEKGADVTKRDCKGYSALRLATILRKHEKGEAAEKVLREIVNRAEETRPDVVDTDFTFCRVNFSRGSQGLSYTI